MTPLKLDLILIKGIFGRHIWRHNFLRIHQPIWSAPFGGITCWALNEGVNLVGTLWIHQFLGTICWEHHLVGTLWRHHLVGIILQVCQVQLWGSIHPRNTFTHFSRGCILMHLLSTNQQTLCMLHSAQFFMLHIAHCTIKLHCTLCKYAQSKCFVESLL